MTMAINHLFLSLLAFWRRIEPGLHVDRDNLIESWDCRAEGRATSIAIEGFGITFTLFIGRTPKRGG